MDEPGWAAASGMREYPSRLSLIFLIVSVVAARTHRVSRHVIRHGVSPVESSRELILCVYDNTRRGDLVVHQ